MKQLSGPWWTNDEAIDPEAEHQPQEAFFRAEFLGTEKATLRIAAQNFYQFWVNGHWQGFGPARAPHGRLTVDEWTLSEDFCGLINTLTIQVLWEGIFAFDHVRGTPGLWLNIERGDESLPMELLATSRTGRVTTHRFSNQRGWVEEIDDRERAAGWPCGKWEQPDWISPVLRRNDPETVLEPRDIAPYAVQTRRALALTFAGACDPKRGSAHRQFFYASRPLYGEPKTSPSFQIQEEALLPSGALDRNLSALTASGEGLAVLGLDPEGLDRTVQLDFGQETSGLLDLCLEAPAGTIIDIGWSEGVWLEDQMSVWARSSHPDGAAAPREFCDARQSLRYVCSGRGIEEFTSLFLAAFRHLRISFRCPEGNAAEIKLHRVQARTLGYPLKREGVFVSDNEDLNRIYQAALATMENSFCDAFMDCPGRERGAYTNDSYWAAVGFQAVTSDVAFERRFLRQFIETQSNMPFDGFLVGLYPSEFSRWVGGTQKPWLGHALFWLIQVDRYLRLSGDASLREEWKPAVARLFEALERSRSPEGVLDNPHLETFLDWSRFKLGSIQTGDNFIYAQALLRMGQLYAVEQWTRQGEQTASAIEQAAWTDGELYSDTVVRDGENRLRPGSDFSAVTNSIALWSELIPQKKSGRVWRQLRNFHPMTHDHPLSVYETNFVRSNAFGLLYRFEHEGRIGDIDGLIRDLKEAYLPMLDRGQTCLSENLGYHGSLCHGFNGFIAHIFNRYLAGIELPDHPGGEIVIRPRPGHLTWCQARVPWMGGHVQVWWNRTASGWRAMVSLPSGERGKFVEPDTGNSTPFITTLSILG